MMQAYRSTLEVRAHFVAALQLFQRDCKVRGPGSSRSFEGFGSESGASLIELALVLPILFLLLLAAVDFGRAYYLAIEVSDAAHAGALYGSQNSTDTAGMQSAAVANASDVPNFTTSSVTASYGCECSDGSIPVATCSTTPSCGSMNVVDYVQVNTSTSYSAMLPYPGIPSSITLRGRARMRAGQ